MIKFETEKLDKLRANLPDFARQVTFKVGERVVAEVQAGWSADSPSIPGEAPAVVSGELAQSITRQVTDEGVYQVGSSSEYAAPLEFGTRKMAARPWLRPALLRVRAQLTTLIKEVW